MLTPLRLKVEHTLNRFRTAEEVFTRVYRKSKWGRSDQPFFSGGGSSESSMVSGYLQLIEGESTSRGFRGKTWLDLGCGDFRVGRQLRPLAGRYIAVDVVAPLIRHHQDVFSGLGVEFIHGDMAGAMVLPPADVVFIRQVLQHLSNRQISAILEKLKQYPLVYITEHYLSGNRAMAPNLDISHGSGTRLGMNSAVFFTEPPFSLPRHQLELVLEVKVEEDGAVDQGVLRTWRYIPD